jgi:predicted pyridoxine 5'-phosphate oxidase superfamily flavin-nucleotide-binding protein
MSYRDALKERQKIILATSSRDGEPRAIAVVSLGFIDGKLLIGACLMRKSLNNIKENNKVSIATITEGGYYRIDGEASIFSEGQYLEIAIKKSNPPLPKSAILIDIKEVVDLDKGEKIV